MIFRILKVIEPVTRACVYLYVGWEIAMNDVSIISLVAFGIAFISSLRDSSKVYSEAKIHN
jgi:hypothetical protein